MSGKWLIERSLNCFTSGISEWNESYRKMSNNFHWEWFQSELVYVEKFRSENFLSECFLSDFADRTDSNRNRGIPTGKTCFPIGSIFVPVGMACFLTMFFANISVNFQSSAMKLSKLRVEVTSFRMMYNKADLLKKWKKSFRKI